MNEPDRVALVGCVWFVVWTFIGDALGHWYGTPGTGMVLGFLFALVTLPAWPWVLPTRLDDWMHDLPPARRGHFSLSLPGWADPLASHMAGRDTKRVALIAAVWFAFWMILAAAIGGLLSKSGWEAEGIYSGFFNGAWWALLTSFAWPWIMPTAINRWMYRSDAG